MPLEARQSEIQEMAECAGLLVTEAHAPTQPQEFAWPALRRPPPCPRCGTAKIARRSRAVSTQGLDQQWHPTATAASVTLSGINAPSCHLRQGVALFV
jgi:hypothetical protein